MSLEGQVLCQRMLIGPCALTMVGAATLAAAPAAATFKKRRRVEVLSLVVMVSSPFGAESFWTGLDLLAATQRLVQGFGNNDRGDATLRRGLQWQKRLARVVVYSVRANIFFAIGMNRFRLKT